MDTPTPEDFATTEEVLAWMITYLEEHNPSAVQSIRIINAARDEIPENAEGMGG